jgi:hypothetical protein
MWDIMTQAKQLGSIVLQNWANRIDSAAVNAARGDPNKAGIVSEATYLMGGYVIGETVLSLRASTSLAGTVAGTTRTVLADGEVMIGVVLRDGTIKIASRGMSHEAFGSSLNLVRGGKFIEGAQPFTVVKEGGQLYVLGSHNFGGVLSISNEAVAAVRAVIQ